MAELKRYSSTFSMDGFDGRSGWLEKRTVEAGCFGRRVHWRRKWFILSGTSFSLYNDPEAALLDSIEIQSDSSVELEGHDGCTITVSSSSQWTVRATSKAEAAEWLTALKAAKTPILSPSKKRERELKSFVVPKGSSSLGISIAGGLGGAGVSRKHIYVLDIHQGSTAAASGLFEKGDIIVEVNGQSLEGASHEDAVRVLKEAAGNVNFKVLRRRKLGRADSIISEESAQPVVDNVDGSGLQGAKVPAAWSAPLPNNATATPSTPAPAPAPAPTPTPAAAAAPPTAAASEPAAPESPARSVVQGEPATPMTPGSAAEDQLSPTVQSPAPDTDEAARRAEMLKKLGKNRLERRASRHHDLLDALAVIDGLSED
eukprot:m.49040 g.49040  ORF g.49040 m.49040 type:complete len:372 (-) comp11442_c0_seq2:190-1305(-)